MNLTFHVACASISCVVTVVLENRQCHAQRTLSKQREFHVFSNPHRRDDEFEFHPSQLSLEITIVALLYNNTIPQ